VIAVNEPPASWNSVALTFANMLANRGGRGLAARIFNGEFEPELKGSADAKGPHQDRRRSFQHALASSSARRGLEGIIRDLQPFKRPSSNSGSNSARWSAYDDQDFLEEQMPTHVMWGEFDTHSSNRSSNANDTPHTQPGDSSAEIPIGTDHFPWASTRKLKNMALYAKKGIEFRSDDPSSATSGMSTEIESDAVSNYRPGLPKQAGLSYHRARSGCDSSGQSSLELAFPVPPDPNPGHAWISNYTHSGDDIEAESSGIDRWSEARSLQLQCGDEQWSQQKQQTGQTALSDLSPAEQEALLQRLPLTDEGKLTSLGSLDHENNFCRPCLFVHTKVGCMNGPVCDFCHFPHKRKNKPRPCKGKRDRYRKLISRMDQLNDQHPDQWIVQAPLKELPPSNAGSQVRPDRDSKEATDDKQPERGESSAVLQWLEPEPSLQQVQCLPSLQSTSNGRQDLPSSHAYRSSTSGQRFLAL